MDYRDLAKELLEGMQKMKHMRPPRKISDTMGGEVFIMKYLSQHQNVLPGDISNKMNISSARVAAALNNLEKKGFISRQIDINDRRRIIVSLTDEGRFFSKKMAEDMLNDAVKMLEFLGEEDAKEWVRITCRLGNFNICDK